MWWLQHEIKGRRERVCVPLLASSAEEKIPRLSPLPPVDLVPGQCWVAEGKRSKDEEGPQHSQAQHHKQASIDMRHGPGVPGNNIGKQTRAGAGKK